MPIISLVAALARNRVIGAANRLPWHLPEDLRRFKRLTLGAPIIMGRRTHESIGKPLPGRRNIIVTRAPGASWDGCEVARSLDDAVRLARPAPEVFVIGGGELYGHALARADRLYLTLIDAEYAGDAWFPAFDADDWREVAREPGVAANGLRFAFVIFERVRSGASAPGGQSSRGGATRSPNQPL
jgi:dihydrofolate reductase